jgi:hypothetical protein
MLAPTAAVPSAAARALSTASRASDGEHRGVRIADDGGRSLVARGLVVRATRDRQLIAIERTAFAVWDYAVANTYNGTVIQHFAADTAPRPTRRPPPERRPPRDPVELLGRGTELERIDAALRSALAQDRSSAFLRESAPPGAIHDVTRRSSTTCDFRVDRDDWHDRSAVASAQGGFERPNRPKPRASRRSRGGERGDLQAVTRGTGRSTTPSKSWCPRFESGG